MRKFSSLNKFIENSTYDVHTKKSKMPDGRKSGKSLDWKSTVEDWKNEALNDCKDNKNDLYETVSDCAKDTLQEDHPEFCLFGSRCINQAVRKAIDFESNKHTNIQYDDIPDEVIELMMKNEIEEGVF